MTSFLTLLMQRGVMLSCALVLLPIGAFFVFLIRRSHAKRRELLEWRDRKAREGQSDKRCIRCGYDLQGLAVPRCPECGTLYGFDKPLDSLGLTEDEVDQIRARQAPAPRSDEFTL
ncbi:MAG TPA: hypothetical protein P5081_09755 [Phycisphaerae bacterium]|nr:hypothetical protein [Phycisphaerae bacterium]HRW53161.1 hypothetical protein [Phycisphaerae bacterium]